MAESDDFQAEHAQTAARIDPDVGVEHIADVYAKALLGAAENAGRTDAVLDEFGRLVDASQRAAERLLGNQIPQTSYLAAAAREHGAVAASAFGAGFGGGVWAMVERDQAAGFLAVWEKAYRGKFSQHADAASFFTTEAGPAAFRVC